MKKLMLLGAAVAMLSVTACKKDYTCECTTADSSGTFADITSSTTIKETKKKATDACEGLTSSVGTLTTSCKIK